MTRYEKALKAANETTGWVIAHPGGFIETDYFSEIRRMSDSKLIKYRPGCIRLKVKLTVVPE